MAKVAFACLAAVMASTFSAPAFAQSSLGGIATEQAFSFVSLNKNSAVGSLSEAVLTALTGCDGPNGTNSTNSTNSTNGTH